MAKTNLVIVESPAKAKTIGKYLGPDYKVKASMGHVRDLPKSKIGVDIEGGFVPDYQPIKGKEETIEDLRKSARSSAMVFLATDPDREGEAISWHLKELLELDDEKAILLAVAQKSLTADEIIDRTQIPARRVLSALTMLQLHSRVEEDAGRRFRALVLLKD